MSGLGTLPRAVLCLVAATALAFTSACTGERPVPNDPDRPPAGLADTVPGKAPVPAERCQKSGQTPVTKVVLTTSDNVHLAGAHFGSGPHGVLLLPQSGVDLCGFFDYAAELVNQGFNVLAIDMRGTGFSEDSATKDYTADAAAGITELRKAGAQRVVIIGASLGGATALVTAGRLPDQVAGVVALSYPDNNVDVTANAGKAPHTPLEAAPLLAAPVMVCFTSGDRQAAKPDDLLAKVPGAAKQMVGRPGVSHGWDMLKVGTDDVRPDILSFLQSYD
jgi:pimeloyl-ACP methyl ester carboxylesterase